MNKKPKKLLIFDSQIRNADLDNEKIIYEETKKYYIKKLGKLGIKERG
jgi:hypothetical protein